jgi:hypothetical protein
MKRLVTGRTIARLLALVLVAGAAFVAWELWPTRMVPPAWAGDYDVTARPPELIAPGTVVGTTAPDGWSHLVIKGLPRVRPSEVQNVPAFGRLGRDISVRMASWMFTAFVADVRPRTQGNETRYHLRAVGLGLGTSVGGRDVVITPETASDHGVELNLITREILTKGYETQKLAVVAVQGPTFALVDTPVWVRCGQKNRLVRYRYALLVDDATGRLDVACWMLDPGGDCGEPGAAVVLNPDQIDEAELIPDKKEFNTLGKPTDAGFAVEGLPPHRARISLPPDLRDLAAKTKFTADDARALEGGLRRLIAP